MIIELAGPPCVGKTTLARALAEKLQSRGLTTNVVLSFRPREMPADAGARQRLIQATAALYRVLRPLWEMASAAAETERGDRLMARALLDALPPRTAFGSMRMWQYIVRLTRSWKRAPRSADVAIFDQGFVQAIYSLALTAPADSSDLARALDSLPQPDLLVRLTAPRDILASRLSERQGHQGVFERLLEVDPETNLASIRIFDQLDSMLEVKGFCVTHVDTSSAGSVQARLDSLVNAVAAQVRCPRPEALH
jgi:thymidylate kinase